MCGFDQKKNQIIINLVGSPIVFTQFNCFAQINCTLLYDSQSLAQKDDTVLKSVTF